MIRNVLWYDDKVLNLDCVGCGELLQTSVSILTLKTIESCILNGGVSFYVNYNSRILAKTIMQWMAHFLVMLILYPLIQATVRLESYILPSLVKISWKQNLIYIKSPLTQLSTYVHLFH